MTPQDIITVSNGKQSRTLTWSEFCFRFVGAKNAATIKRMAEDLDAGRDTSWFDGNSELAVKKGDTK